MHKDLVPDIDLEIGYKNLSTGEVFTVNDTKTQMKNYPSTSFEKIFEIATLKASKLHSHFNKVPSIDKLGVVQKFQSFSSGK